ncbi:DUF2007 domain-containing protein [Alcanivorax sp. S6407]|uniref:putative signal transducing protein n=1 Tax=Alcanivorax sp. S6407 TaxID=2926424 RepID=UPI001FF3BD44|nr:DUF2007 domain-containing protein [Alcanivorax sp. S6407]MCK0154232.1 DUF2007 domain-containing protein [Alcanivorax sp. S6407]
MRKLFSTIDRTEAWNAKFLLESNGVPIYIGGEHTGPAPGVVVSDAYTVWVCLDEQFEDAYRFMEDDSHEISCPINVDEFYRATEEAKKEKKPWSSDRIMLPLMAAAALGFVAWIVSRISET